jgi:tetraacyldisaccharide 4'-kinase
VNPLSATYGAIAYTRNLLYDSGFFSAQLEAAVISIGSISSGGAGKTPFVLALGELLKGRRLAFDVLSRGYARESRGVLLVDPEGDAREFGDEPLLIALRLGVPVIVGENRYHAGLLAEQRFRPQLHLLDDGFQHRALSRDFDIVLLTEADTCDKLLPGGRLREPLASLQRADAVVLINGVALPSVELKRGARVWRAWRKTTIDSVPSRPVVFCGIARPKGFFAELHTLGVNPVAEIVFRDHHAYDEQDVQRLMALAREKGAGGFITTQKDKINLGSRAAALAQLTIAELCMEIEQGSDVISSILEGISGRRQGGS